MQDKVFTISRKFRKPALLAAVAVLCLLLIGAGILATHWLFSEAKVKQSLQGAFPATITFEKFHSTYFPHPGCVAEGATFHRLGAPSGLPPIVTIQSVKIEAHYLDIFLRPGYLARIDLHGFHLQIPELGTPVQDTGWKSSPSKTRIGEITADGAVIDIARSDSREPLRFAVHTLKLNDVSREKPLSYELSLHNPVPPGEIQSRGKFGPWNSQDPGQTPLQGQYTFRGADLSVFPGIAGILSSEDSFQGPLRQIETRGKIDVPGFMVTRTRHPVHVASEYHAFVDATNGNVVLERVNGAFLHTNVAATGEIAGHPREHGKTTNIDLTVRDGHIQDVLVLFVKEPRAPLNGVTSFTAHVTVPPEDRPFLQRLRLTGNFGIQGSHFTKASTQSSVDTLSEKARGLKTDPPPDPQDADQVISNLAGHVELRNEIANFSEFSFAVPGAEAHMHGTFHLERHVVDLHGTLKTDTEFSNMTTGFKSVLLKPFNAFFRRKRAGAVLPVHLVGTYEHPDAGLDLPAKKGSTANTQPHAR